MPNLTSDPSYFKSYTQYISGAKVVNYPPSSFEVGGTGKWTVECPRHLVNIEFSSNYFLLGSMRLPEAVWEALKKCSYCISEIEYGKSRFPEGAEL